MSSPAQQRMKRVVIDQFGGPEVLKVVEDDIPQPGPGEVRVRVLAAGVSFSDALLRAGVYLGGPKPPFTPGYELVGVVEELGPGGSRLRVGDHVAALTVWGDAERVCVPEKYAVETPEDLDAAEVVSLVLPYMTAYQLLHRVARVKSGEAVLVHGAAGRVGTAVLELGALAGLGLYGTASARDRAAVEQLGAVAIDYRNEDFLERVRSLPGKGVDVVLDGLGGAMSVRSFRALRPGGRLVVFGYSSALTQGRRSRRAWIKWNTQTGSIVLRGLLSPRRGPHIPDRQAPQPPPGVVPRGLPRATRAPSSSRDPPSRVRAPSAHGSAPRARAAGEFGGDGKARARAMTPSACGISARQ
jgi:NADPH:quinone reductase